MNNVNSNDANSTLIALAIAEDLADRGDITAQALIGTDEMGSFAFRARKRGIVSGIEIAAQTLVTFDQSIVVKWNLNDGDVCEVGADIGTVSGPLRSILSAERTTLNFLQHLSGVATLTRIFVDELAKINSTTIIRDTRKTLPGYRMLEKRAVVHGGGHNHRMGLYDSFLVKDNHLVGTQLAGAVDKCREYDPKVPLEVEVDTLEQLNMVLQHRPDLVMLDNFSVEDVMEARRRAPMTDFEVSGGVTFQNLKEYGATNVKYIAIGALTHSAPSLDIGLDAI